MRSGVLDLGQVRLAWTSEGRGDPIVFVHGSWDDHRSWDRVATPIAEHSTVIRYDRRGHTASTAPRGQGSILEDVSDLLAVVDSVAGGRAHLVGHSYGSSIVLLATAKRPEAVRSVLVHEPPLFAALSIKDPLADELRLAAAQRMREAAELLGFGDVEAGTRTFVEHVGFGEGSWLGLFTAEQRATMMANAETWLDQYRDPDRLAVDASALAGLGVPVTVTTGGDTLPIYRAVVRAITEQLPEARVHVIPGAGHAPQLSHPTAFVEAVRSVL
ncbi:alpha/beta fold hydrolase [Allokutzneria sp. NRRL B-24872]|uniref:alpha/beta fold hydrolase n=1 Tax=Allokutzneria sp. NRRL B-24872 TaxID=1137961 RepID=UPI000A38BF4C|nr:alpha/beta hydrolase [Allokutzneria sp. NRRL B-24872]